jgi:hypothetical protein
MTGVCIARLREPAARINITVLLLSVFVHHCWQIETGETRGRPGCATIYELWRRTVYQDLLNCRAIHSLVSLELL